NVTTEVVQELVDAAVSEDPIEGEYCLLITVTEPGVEWWDMGLENAGHIFEADKKYTLSAFVKCKEGELDINFKIELGEDPWTGYAEQSFTMTEEWTEFSITTPVFTENVSPAICTFHIGFAAAEFWIDGVRFFEGDYVPPDLRGEFASSPNPADGAIHTDTWASLSWEPGKTAVSHDVYFGESFDDVNDGTGPGAPGFQVNQGITFFVVGFPGYPYPDGLVPGTTYYWRIDELNEAEPESPWKGDVWSFTVPPIIAYDPIPADGAKFIDPDIEELSWSAGHGAKVHTVYFGDDFDTVNNAADGLSQGLTTYSPGTLELEKTYYWRVDEFDGIELLKGDVWSFTITSTGGGIRADYYEGMNFDNHVLTRIDPQINFDWGDPGSPDPAVGDDNFSVRWTGEVEAAFTETYTFYPTTNDGVRLWVDGQLLVDRWFEQSPTENRGTIDLAAGNTYGIVMEYFENDGGAVAELRWSSTSTPKQLIPQAALSPPLKAGSSNPRNKATDVIQIIVLNWGPGDHATSHEVYFGTDEDAVKNATTSSPEYKGTKAIGSESYDPGKLLWNSTYYWRVDEVNTVHPESPWVGSLWSFTTANYLLVEDFEGYDAGDNQIWYAWHDGLGYGTPGTDPYFAGNGTGAAVGDETTASYTEENIVHGGSKSMPIAYDNYKQGYAYYSEVEHTLTDHRDWTVDGITELSLWFRGYPGSVGNFVEGPIGTYTVTGSGADIWAVNGAEADEFHFAYKTLSGPGSIVARVQSIENTSNWAKAGVMIRETLDPDSAHAMMAVTPSEGVSFQRRPETGGTSVDNTTGGITAPYWVKIERDSTGRYMASYSTNGSTWEMQGLPSAVQMGTNVYIGLAVTAHDVALTCEAVFSNVTTTGTVGPQWAHQDIGIASNDAEPLYVALSNRAGDPAVVVHDDPAAAQLDTWTEWVIPLQAFADQGIFLTDVDRIAIGLGTRANTTLPGGSGKMYFDDIRLLKPEPQPEP
ncbi:PA14 domain-containing protein, partial [Planctomycetota bacterium]